MKKILLSKKGEGYVDVVIGIFAIMMVVVVVLNIFEFMTLKQDLDEISGQLIEVATYNGDFGVKFHQRSEQLKDQFFDFDVSTSADVYFSSAYNRVQLGDKMEVSVSIQTYVQGLGLFRIPITVTSHRSGISEKYWK